MRNELLGSLQEHFDAFFNQDDYRYFTRGLIQYLDFIVENPDLNNVLSKIKAIEDQDYAFYKSLEGKTLKEEESSEKELRKIIKKNKINSPVIKKLLGKIDAHRNGLSIPFTRRNLRNPAIMDSNIPLAWSSREFCYLLDDILFKIAIEIDKLGQGKLIKNFIDTKNVRNNIYGDWVFSYTYFQAIDELNRLLIERKGKIYDYYWIVKGALNFDPDSQNNLVKYNLGKYKFAVQSVHLFIKDTLNEQVFSKQESVVEEKTIKEVKREVKYTDNREIYIGKKFLKKLTFMSERERVFDYVYRNPNKEIKRSEIEKELGVSVRATLPNIIKDVGFSGDLKKKFFPTISNAGLKFINPPESKSKQ